MRGSPRGPGGRRPRAIAGTGDAVRTVDAAPSTATLLPSPHPGETTLLLTHSLVAGSLRAQRLCDLTSDPNRSLHGPVVHVVRRVGGQVVVRQRAPRGQRGERGRGVAGAAGDHAVGGGPRPEAPLERDACSGGAVLHQVPE